MKHKEITRQFDESGLLEFILYEVVEITKGTRTDYTCTHIPTREMVLDLLFSALSNHIKTACLEVHNTANILKLLKDEIITIEEVKQLMEALRTQVETDILPDLQNKLEELEGKSS